MTKLEELKAAADAEDAYKAELEKQEETKNERA
jgi:hypothetical protein